MQVDVEAFEAKAGDLFMVCSDGLTSMVREDKLKPLLAENERPLEALGRELIAAANAAGGRDNITVILFTLEEIEAAGADASSRPPRRACSTRTRGSTRPSWARPTSSRARA